jgi:hypothetical protein
MFFTVPYVEKISWMWSLLTLRVSRPTWTLQGFGVGLRLRRFGDFDRDFLRFPRELERELEEPLEELEERLELPELEPDPELELELEELLLLLDPPLLFLFRHVPLLCASLHFYFDCVPLLPYSTVKLILYHDTHLNIPDG